MIDGPLMERARGLLDLAGAEPASAIAAAESLAAEAHDDDRARAVALRALGLAHAKLMHIAAAGEALAAAVAAGRRSADRSIEAEAAMTQAAVLSWAGDAAGADVAISFAVNHLTGTAMARALVQRASMRYRQGRFAEALADQGMARPVLEEAGDTGWLASLHMDRGIIRGFTGQLTAARTDLATARAMYRSLGRSADAAWAMQNEGWLLTQIGDIPGALATLDAAEDQFRSLGLSVAALWSDRCEALMTAHLTHEAKEYAGHALTEAERSGLAAGVAEARLRLAEAALLDADATQARHAAEVATAEFTAQDRPMWAAYARYLAIQARIVGDGFGEVDLGELIDVAHRLDDGGFASAALHARVLAGRVAAAGGQLDRAAALLGEAAAARRTGSVELRAQAWLAEALVRLAAGRPVAADAAVRAGMRAVDVAQSMFASSDARAHVAAHATDLAELGLDLAYASGSTTRVFQWLERTRAGALRHPSPRPPDDAELAAELAQLRAVEAELRHARLEGEPVGGLEQRAGRLRGQVRRRSLRRSGAGTWALSHPPRPSAVNAVLGAATMVELGIHGGMLDAVVVGRGRAIRHVCGSVAAIDEELALLRAGMARLARGDASSASRAASGRATELSLLRLDDLILQRLGLGDEPVVVVPPASLHLVPWALLPSMRGRAVTVAPSAALWLDRIGPPQRTRRGVVVAHGPDLPGAAAEARQVARLHGAVTRLTARTSKVEDVLKAIDGARLAHFVAHGTFRNDNPLFSSLRLADGALTVYDMERVDRLPPIVVLSACNSGLQAVRPGGETMGMVAALLGAGCRTVVASTGLVPDTARTARTMVDFHTRLAAGEMPAAALAAAQAAAVRRRGAAAAPFVCFGAG